MAVDNLNYYSSWLPAWQQTDKYTIHPWCLKSKNLDIFSSSKSVKATAWSEPETTGQSWVVLVDQTWNLILKSDWNVYDISSGSEVLVKSGIASNFPVYQVSYNWMSWTYSNAQRWTEKQLLSKYENGNLKYFTIFTDRARYSYSFEKYKVYSADEIYTTSGWTELSGWGAFSKNGSWTTTYIRLKVANLKWLTKTKLSIQADNVWSYTEEWHITISSIVFEKPRYYYDAETEDMNYRYSSSSENLSFEQLDDSISKEVLVDIPLVSISDDYDYYLKINLKHTAGTDGTHTWSHGEIYINVLNYDDYYSYLWVNEDRKLVDVWEYYWEKWLSNQTLYNWNEEWVDDANWQRVVRYNLEKYMAWANDVSMDVVSMIAWNEQVYMIGNMNWNWYIIPCDLTWGRWTPYIAYGCTFKWATNIDYLLYLVWEDRGISQLWVYNGQELVAIVWGNKEKNLIDLIDTDEQYNFDWKMVEYRGDLVLATSDNRIFQYGQTFWGKGWTFIHQLDGEIKELKAEWDDLIVRYGEWLRATKPYVNPWLIPFSWEFDINIYSENGQAVVATLHMMGNTDISEIISEYGNTYNFSYLSDELDGDKLDNRVTVTEYDDPNFYIVPNTRGSYITKYQDDTTIKNYNTEWEAEYPIVIWNHLLEKEESDLYASYILPSADTSLEFWGMANHYHFWTFTSEDDATLDPEEGYKIAWATWDYALKFIERNENQYTFRLEGDLPIQTTNEMKITDSEDSVVINYSDFNHFRKIWEITTDKYCEWEFRFHNINNKLELPKSHSLQILVRGKGTANYTPELFALDLVANQRDRW